MLCYSFLDKRGDYIKKLINWTLKNNDEVIINNESVECEFENNVIKYIENDNINIVDLNKDIYIRENNEFTFKVDFKNRKSNYILKEKDFKIDDIPLNTEIIKNKNEIILIYSLDNEEKRIIIHLL